MIDPWLYVLALIGGIVAGITNTLAGSGSLITLPVLVMLGLPVHEANGTNRVGIILQNIVALGTLKRQESLNIEGVGAFSVPIILGSLLGAYIAIDVSKEALNLAIGCIMVGMFVVLLAKPKRWLEKEEREFSKKWYYFPMFFVVGIYGGFIQAGVGILLLMSLVLGVGFDVVKANGMKLLLALIFTLPVLGIFVWHGDVRWGMGFLMAAGQSIGAYLAARFAAGSERAPIWIRRMLLLITVVGALKFLYPVLAH